ncbi:MAG: DUF1428 family protein [Candidatus Methanofastidiosia archaeon]
MDINRGDGLMYVIIYIFRVPKRNVDAVLRVDREANAIYKHYGALDSQTYIAANLEAKYGCATFGDVLDVAEDEVILVGINCFRDRAHHNEVMAKVDSDERINELYTEVIKLFDIGRTVRGEFEHVL